MEPDDVPTLTRMYNQRSVAAGTLQILYNTSAERGERYQQSQTLRILVAEIDAKVVGEGALTLHRGRRKHVGSIGIAVDESLQNQGIGTRLMEALMDLADNWYALKRVELEVYSDNLSAIHLYEKFGFRIEGTHPAYAFREGSYVDVVSMGRLRPVPTVGGEG